MAAPDPYRDELRAAQNRIALLEEQLADRGPSDDDDPEIVRLLAARRVTERSTMPRVAAGRALIIGLTTTLLAAVILAWMSSTMAHPNHARLAVLALGSGVTTAWLLYFMMITSAMTGLASLDKDLAARRRSNEEARRLASIDHRLRVEEANAAEPAPGARIAITEDAETEAERADERSRALR